MGGPRPLSDAVLLETNETTLVSLPNGISLHPTALEGCTNEQTDHAVLTSVTVGDAA